MYINLKHKHKFLFPLFVLFLVGTMLLSSITASAHDAYFLAVAFDDSSMRYMGNVTFQSNSLIGGNHAECDVSTAFYKYNHGQKGYTLPVINYGDKSKSAEDIAKLYSKYDTKDYDGKELLFTFPSFHTKGFLTDKLDGNASDNALAQRVVDDVISDLNNAIAYVFNATGTTRSSESVRNVAAKLGTKSLRELGGKKITTKYGVSKDSLKKAKITIPAGYTASDYMSITVGNDTNYFIYQCNKGYKYNSNKDKSADPLARDIGTGDYYKDEGKNDSVKIGWGAIVLQAHFNKDVRGVTFSNMGEIVPTNALISAVAGFCDWVITSVRSFLGLYDINELMLNSGKRGTMYSLGMFPKTWAAPAYLLHFICQMLAWAIMGFAVIRMLMKRQLATINIGEKVSMMNEIKNLLICGFLLGSFPLVFNMLGRINYSLVNLFGASSEFTNTFTMLNTVSGVSMGSILCAFFFLIFSIYFNFFYMLRAITIAILYGIAPLCIYTLALGGKHSKIFSAFSKELMSNIFIQTIHAIMLSFFASVTTSMGLTTFELLVVLFSFIPLTKFIKQNVFQMSDGITGLAGGLAGAVTGGAAAAVGRKDGGSASGGASSSSGSFKGGKDSSATGMLADRMSQNKSASLPTAAQGFKDTLAGSSTSTNTSTSASASVSNGSGSAPGLGTANFGAFNGGKTASNVVGAESKVNRGLSSLSPNMNDVNNSQSKVLGRMAGGVLAGTATALGGMAVSSFDSATGNRMIKNGFEHGGKRIRSGVEAYTQSGQSKVQFDKERIAHGVHDVKSDGLNNYVQYDMAEKDADGNYVKPENMSQLEYQNINRMARAFDENSDMDDEEREMIIGKANAAGITNFGMLEGKLTAQVDKTYAASKSPNFNPVTHAGQVSIPNFVSMEDRMRKQKAVSDALKKEEKVKSEVYDCDTTPSPSVSPSARPTPTVTPTPSPSVSEDKKKITNPLPSPSMEQVNSDNRASNENTTPSQPISEKSMQKNGYHAKDTLVDSDGYAVTGGEASQEEIKDYLDRQSRGEFR